MKQVYKGTTLINDIFIGSDRVGNVIPPVQPFIVEYVVAGGGAGGGSAGGGGGGGEVATGSIQLTYASTYNIFVGNGGLGGTQATGYGQNGETSSIYLSTTEILSVLGGGSGSGYAKDTITFYNNGGDGGSGGGARSAGTGGLAIGDGLGNDGGTGPYSGGGGGAEITDLIDGRLNLWPTGGATLTNLIPLGDPRRALLRVNYRDISTGAPTYVENFGITVFGLISGSLEPAEGFTFDDFSGSYRFSSTSFWRDQESGNGGNPTIISWNPYNNGELGAGGGGGQFASSLSGTNTFAGNGGGTTGGDGGVIQQDYTPVRQAGDAPANSAAGGGGGGISGAAPFNVQDGGDGGSGLVLFRYPGSPRATGGVITQLGGQTIHAFTSSGEFIIPNAYAF